MTAMTHRDRLMLAIAAACFLIILIIEEFAPVNVVGAYGYVLPILLVTTLRNRTILVVTVLACVVATYSGLLQPTKPAVMTTSETPRRMSSRLSPMACAPEAQAEVTVKFGPRAP